MIVNGVTRTGFNFTVDTDALNDMEFIDALCETMDDNPIAFSKVCTRLLGSEQKKELYNHLRKEGRVTVESVGDAIADIFGAIGEEGKNS